MKCTWRIFKFSRFCDDEELPFSYCGEDLTQHSQIITHSVYKPKEIKKEKWLHIYNERNKHLEITLFEGIVKIIMYSDKNKSLNVTLESVECWMSLRSSVKARTLALRINDENNEEKRLQITFYSVEDVEKFYGMFNEHASTYYVPHETRIKNEAIENLEIKNFLKEMENLSKGILINVDEFKTSKHFIELKNEFLDLLK